MLAVAWPITLAAVALLFMDVVLMGLRLSWLLRPHGLHLPVGRAVKLTLVAFFFGIFMTGATGGDVARLFYASSGNSGRRAEISTVVILDRALGLLSLLMLPVLFAPMSASLLRRTPPLQVLLIAVVGAALGLCAVLAAGIFGEPLIRRLARRPLERLAWSGVGSRVLRTLGVYRRHPGTLLGALTVSLAASSLLVPVTGLAILTLNPSGWSGSMCFIVPMGYIVNSVPLTPSGLGVGEAAFNALFAVAGLNGGAEALLCWRLWTAVVGLAGLVFYLRGLGRVVFEAEDVLDGAEATNRVCR